MPITYTINQGKRLITEIWTGEIHAAELGKYWRHYLADPAVLAIRRTIADLSGADIRFKGVDLDGLIKGIALPMLNGRDWKTAIVVNDPVQFGVGRQYQAFAQCFSKDAIFNSIEEAEAWILNSDSVKE